MEYTVARVAEVNWNDIKAVELVHQPWLEPCDIKAKAQLCHDGENLYVRMEAEEKNIRALETRQHEAVCVDSCLEFFFAPLAGDRRYFNFEVNLLGNLYVGFGAERPTRVRQIVRNRDEMFAPKPFRTEKGWGIEYRIPLHYVQLYMPDAAYAGEAAGNFYKCGDLTEKPHYLAWAPLTSEKPDYHRRGDFGRLIFE